MRFLGLMILIAFLDTVAAAQVIKFQSAGDAGSITSSNTSVVHFGSFGSIVTPAGSYAGFFWAVPDFQPARQASNITFSDISSTRLTLSFTKGNGDRRIVVGKQGSAVDATPTNGVGYNANTVFGSGPEIAPGNYVVFDGDVAQANSVTVTGLSLETNTYFFKVFEYNGKYLSNISNVVYQNANAILNPLPTPPFIASGNIVFSDLSNHEMTLTWQNGSGANRILIGKSQSMVDATPQNGNQYPANSAYGWGTELGSGNYVLFNGATNTATITGLKPNTTYYFHLTEYNGSDGAASYASGVAVSKLTLTDPTTVQEASAITQTSFDASWTSVEGSADFYIDISSDDFASTVPGYNNKLIPGMATQVTGLQPGTLYQYRVRASNASGQSDNSNPVSVLTISPTPAELDADAITTSGFTARWTPSKSATDYFIDASSSPSFESFLPGFNDQSTSGSSTFVVSGLDAGTHYYFRVRSRNASGISPSSATYDQITLCEAPVPNNADDIQSTSFKAQWEPVTGANGYEVSVSTSVDFTNDQVPGSPFDAGNLPELYIQDLDPETIYRYRVRAKNDAGFSEPSNVKTVLTKTSNGEEPDLPIVNLVNNNSRSSVKAQCSGGLGKLTLTLKHRPIRAAKFISEAAQEVSKGITEMILDPSWLDELGMEYYFVLADDASRVDSTARAFVYQLSAGKTIPGLSAGRELENYRIISIPYSLDDNLIQSIFFGPLGDYDDTKWRLIHYDKGKNVDYPGFNRIETGLGYWFISANAVELTVGPGASEFHQQNEFSLRLNKGWNQVGDPYPFDLDWDDVLAYNDGKPVSSLTVFNSTTGILTGSNSLKAWSGGFVFADEAIPEFIFPVSKVRSSGRTLYNTNTISSSNPDEPEWFVPLTLRQGIAVNDLTGIGMHPEASSGKDRFDAISPPRFIRYLEMTTNHGEFFAPSFSRDVVPTSDRYTWNFTVASNLSDPMISLSWNRQEISHSTAQLVLFDEASQFFVDMRSTDRYEFDPLKGGTIRIVYSRDEGSLNVGSTFLGRPHPNPATTTITIPVSLNETGFVSVYVTDITGRNIRTLCGQSLSAGVHTITWNADDDTRLPVPHGMYFIRMLTAVSTSVQKVIIE